LVIFDLLWLDGHSTMPLPYTERRRFLLELQLSGPAWQSPPHEVGDGAATIAVTEQFGLEGVVAKRLDAPYEPGRRSRAWMKWKRLLQQEFVVGGWMPGTNARTGQIGSLLVGYYDREDGERLCYAVGSEPDSRKPSWTAWAPSSNRFDARRVRLRARCRRRRSSSTR